MRTAMNEFISLPLQEFIDGNSPALSTILKRELRKIKRNSRQSGLQVDLKFSTLVSIRIC